MLPQGLPDQETICGECDQVWPCWYIRANAYGKEIGVLLQRIEGMSEEKFKLEATIAAALAVVKEFEKDNIADRGEVMIGVKELLVILGS
jgi:hypothetical protein